MRVIQQKLPYDIAIEVFDYAHENHRKSDDSWTFTYAASFLLMALVVVSLIVSS